MTRHNLTLPATVDCICALAIVVGSVCWSMHIHHNDLAEFLAIRVTLLNVSFSIVYALLWKQLLKFMGLYSKELVDIASTLKRTAFACLLMTMLVACYLQLRQATHPLGLTLGFVFLASFCFEILRIHFANQLLWRFREPQSVLILGTGRQASKAWRELRLRHHRRKKLLGFFDDRDLNVMPPDIASRYIGRVEDLSDYFLRNAVDELIIAVPMRSCYDIGQNAVRMAEAAGVRVVIVNEMFSLTHERQLRQRIGLFTELLPRDQTHRSALTLKRLVDFSLSGICLIVLLPVLLLIAAAIRLTSRGPALSAEPRYGFARREFSMYKFRTVTVTTTSQMSSPKSDKKVNAHAPSDLMNGPKLTRLGRFLQANRMDDLPQLWNVFLGDMSLVGPRAISVEDVALFSDIHLMRRFSVRPGITGTWQISDLKSPSSEYWMRQESNYFDDWSLVSDLKILAQTIPAVVKKQDAA